MQQVVPLILMLGVMFAVLWIPQQRKQKETRQMLASLEEGDEVIMNSGVHGFIATIDDNVVWLEVSPGVELKISRSAVAGKVNVQDPVEDDEADEADD